MNYRVETIDHERYLYYVVSGVWDVSESLEVWRDITDRLKGKEKSKALVDERKLEIVTDVSADFSHAQQLTRLLIPVYSRIATLQSDDNIEINRFYETVCVNRGLNIRYFREVQDALDWLS